MARLISPYVSTHEGSIWNFTWLVLDPQQGSLDHASKFATEPLNQRALFVSNNAVFSAGHTLATAGFTLVILLTAVNMAVFLELYRSTPRARVSDDHGYCWPPS